MQTFLNLLIVAAIIAIPFALWWANRKPAPQPEKPAAKPIPEDILIYAPDYKEESLRRQRNRAARAEARAIAPPKGSFRSDDPEEAARRRRERDRDNSYAHSPVRNDDSFMQNMAITAAVIAMTDSPSEPCRSHSSDYSSSDSGSCSSYSSSDSGSSGGSSD